MNTPKRKPCKGDKSLSCLQHRQESFVPSALGLLGPGITGAYTPACSLISLSGLCLAGPNNPLNLSNHLERNGQAIIFRTQCDFLLTIEVSTFSGQVFVIEAIDAAIFTRIKDQSLHTFPKNSTILGVSRVIFEQMELFLTQFWAYFLPLTNKFCCLFSLVR